MRNEVKFSAPDAAPLTLTDWAILLLTVVGMLLVGAILGFQIAAAI